MWVLITQLFRSVVWDEHEEQMSHNLIAQGISIRSYDRGRQVIGEEGNDQKKPDQELAESGDKAVERRQGTKAKGSAEYAAASAQAGEGSGREGRSRQAAAAVRARARCFLSR